MTNAVAKTKVKETPLLFRLLIVLTIVGILVTLMPSLSGVAQADYDSAPVGGGDPDL